MFKFLIPAGDVRDAPPIAMGRSDGLGEAGSKKPNKGKSSESSLICNVAQKPITFLHDYLNCVKRSVKSSEVKGLKLGHVRAKVKWRHKVEKK